MRGNMEREDGVLIGWGEGLREREEDG